MPNRAASLLAALLLALLAPLTATPTRAADKITAATVGSIAAIHWPTVIAMEKGLYKEQGIELELLFVQSSAQLVQQVAAGSLDMASSTGLVDPIRAVEKGAAVAILWIDVQSPPYVLMAKPAIKTLKDLAGKTISIGGPKDITRIYVERMLAPSGIKSGQFDTVFAGATSARTQALLAGAVDAAIVLPPFNFQAAAAGFTDLGHTIDFAPDLLFSGAAVNTAWASAHKDVLRRLLVAQTKAVAWFGDEKNRAEAIAMMVKASKLKTEDVTPSYDFFRKSNFFEATGKVSKKRLSALVDALVSLGDIGKIEVEKLVLPGVTQLSE